MNSPSAVFDEQFAHPETILVDGAPVEVWDLVPETTKYQTPILFVPAWAATPRSYKEGLRVHFQAGRRVITLAFNPHAREVIKPGIPTSLATKTHTILEVLRTKQIDMVDGIGHSEGIMLLVIAAGEQSGQFRNLILEGPVGITGKQSYFQLLIREAANLVQYFREKRSATEEERESMRQKTRDVKHWIKSVGLLRCLSDGLLPGRFETHSLIKQVSLHHGISIISAVDDKMIDIGKIHYKNRIYSVDENGDYLIVDGFYPVPGGHFSFEVKAQASAKLAESALKTLEEHQQNQTEFRYKVAKTPEEKQLILELVEKMYKQQDYYVESSPEQKQFEKYIISAEAKSFLAFINKNFFATISVIKDSKLGLPLDSVFSEEIAPYRAKQFKLAEVSQFAVDQEILRREDHNFSPSKQLSATLPLLSLVMHYAFYAKLDYLFISISPKHEVFYKTLGFKQVGGTKFYSAVNTPAITLCLDMQNLKNRNNLPGILNKFIDERIDERVFMV